MNIIVMRAALLLVVTFLGGGGVAQPRDGVHQPPAGPLEGILDAP